MIKEKSLGKSDISALKKGDTVAVISTARKVSPEELDFAITKIKSWGLNVCFGNNLFKITISFLEQHKSAQMIFSGRWTTTRSKLFFSPEVVMVPFMLLITLIGIDLKQIQSG